MHFPVNNPVQFPSGIFRHFPSKVEKNRATLLTLKAGNDLGKKPVFGMLYNMIFLSLGKLKF